MIKKINFITLTYPNKVYVERGAFVASLVDEWIKNSIYVDVIAPMHYPLWIKSLFIANSGFKTPPASKLIEPKFFALSRFFLEYSRQSFVNQVVKYDKKLTRPNVYYGKFLMYSGKSISMLSQINNIPAFVDIGESKLLKEMDVNIYKEAKEITKKLTGAVVVSKRLKLEMIELGMNEKDILIAQNGIDINLFKKMNRQKCRQILNLPQNKFLISFVGHFIDRKGPLRVLEAVEKINNKNIQILFLGNGKLPDNEFILKAEAVNHEELPLWLNASDTFVLPTLAEGNCNAINEAMGCGLPIITSNIEDVKCQVKDNAILVNPKDTNDIAKAIMILYKTKSLREKMEEISLEIAKNLNISNRANKILEFMNYYIHKKSFNKV